MGKYKIGDKVLAYRYDSFGYYRGDDLGDAVEVELLDSKIVKDVKIQNLEIDGDIEVFLTKDENHNWNEYADFELFKSQEEIDKMERETKL